MSDESRTLSTLDRIEAKLDGLVERLARIEVHHDHTARAVDDGAEDRARIRGEIVAIRSEIDVERGRRKALTAAGGVLTVPGLIALGKAALDWLGGS